MSKSKNKSGNRTITQGEISKRAEVLLTAITLLYECPNKTMPRTEFVDLLKEVTNVSNTMQVLRAQGLITSVSNGSRASDVKYTSIAPNIVVCRKVIEGVIAKGREFIANYEAKKRNNKVKTVAEISAITVKPAPLHYASFMKELAILKERYKMAVPNAEVELTVKIYSLATV